MQKKSAKTHKIVKILVDFTFISLILITNITAQTEEADKKLFERASDSLKRLEKAVRNDGFTSAMAALNMWRCNAQDAGIFEQAMYDDFKKKIYKKSINGDLRWFEKCVREGWVEEATFCAKLYYYKSNVIGIFDQEKYDYMKAKIQDIQDIKEQKTSR